MSDAPVSRTTAQATRQARLHHVSDDAAGIHRRRAGRGFYYVDAEGKRLADETDLARIRKLAIPPAWNDVWICADVRGHLQATGRDARGRKQYRYHARWREVRDEHKFARLIDFASRLDRLRKKQKVNLARQGMPQQKVVAIAVAVMEQTLIRIGNREYTRSNRSYGLTTLTNRHISFPPGKVRISFRGKGGKACDRVIDDVRLRRLLHRCHELPGRQLFTYLDDDGSRHDVESGMVNAYLHEAMGEEFTAKDFRTWGATVDAASLLAATRLPDNGSETALNQVQAEIVREVAQLLGNTPAVCRRSYIHPGVFTAWRAGKIARYIPKESAGQAPEKIERAVIKLLRSHS